MSIDNVNSEHCDNIFTVGSQNVVYDLAKQEQKKVKTSIAIKNLRSTNITIRVKLRNKENLIK